MKYVIVGGGPTGIALAWRLNRAGNTCVLVEASDSLGGCHSVQRKTPGELVARNPDGSVHAEIFSEHGPRVYSSSFRQFERLLDDMGIDFKDVFEPLPTAELEMSLTPSDMYKLARTYLAYSVGLDYSRISMLDYMKDFSGGSIDYISRLVLLVDGVPISRFSVQSFMNLINYEALNKFYRPKIANDKKLFHLIETALSRIGVAVIKSEKCQYILTKDQTAYGISTIGMKHGKPHHGGRTILADKVILALSARVVMGIPALNIVDDEDGWKLGKWKEDRLGSSGIGSGYGKPAELTFEEKLKRNMPIENPFQIPESYLDSEYMNYHSVCFSWKNKVISFSKGNPSTTTHGLIHQDLDFTPGSEKYGQIVSCGITLPDVKWNNKDVESLEDYELVALVWDNLLQLYPDLPKYDQAALGARYPTISRSDVNWRPLRTDCAFKNLHTVGPHTSTGAYGFTSIESAVGSGNEFAGYSNWFYYSINMVVLMLVIIIAVLIGAYRVYRGPAPIVYG